MPKDRSGARVSLGSVLLLATLVGALGCGHRPGDAGLPEATLATNADAQAAFRALRGAWFSGGASERRKLEPALREFLVRFPNEGPSDLVRVLLAFGYVNRGRLVEARALLAQVRVGLGSVADFARVAEASALLRENHADAASRLLEPLSGKIVDPDERRLFSELRLRSAAAAGRYSRALLAAEELLSEAPSEAQGGLQALVRESFQRAPKAELLASLTGLSATPPGEGAGNFAREWLGKMLREQLVAIAVHEKDAGLARSLLDSAPAALRASESGSALLGIAGAGQSAPLISGSSVGVALSLGSADLRRRSASVAAGLARGLGLPEAAREKGSIHLLSHEDGGTSAGTWEALGDLAAEGAAILVAGFDGPSADIAARFAEQNAIAVVLLTPPETFAGPLSFAFVLGESASREQAALDAELSRRGLLRVARVGRLGEACDAPGSSASSSRFPATQWRSEHVSALLVLGSAACASDVLVDLTAADFFPTLALGLEAADFVYSNEAKGPRFALGAGRFPSEERPDRSSNPALPALDWYEALGHDAALLTAGALEGFPEGRVDDREAVRELHERAERALSTAEAPLWTSEARGFSQGHLLARTLTIVSPHTAPKKTP